MSKNKLMPTIVLSAICICVVALLALINMFTAPQIAANQEEKLQNALLEVMPKGGSFEEIENIESLPESVTDVFKSANGGYVIQIKTAGYKTGLVIVCGIDAEGQITGAKFTQSNETLGAESVLGEKYVGKTLTDYTSVEVVSGATMTSKGYQGAIADALAAFEILKGGNE